MVNIKSERAKNLLASPQAMTKDKTSHMRKYPGNDFNLWAEVVRDQEIVKKLSFYGEVEGFEAVLLESLAALIFQRPLSLLENLSLRECEAYLRDRNSELSLDHLSSLHESKFRKLFAWIRSFPEKKDVQDYQYDLTKGPLSRLKLTDKIRELKAFLNSPQIQNLYSQNSGPELIDVEDLTVYVHVPYQTNLDKELLEKLHALGVEMFDEENLNFIPEF
jgi:hypothetical protein